MITAKEIQFAKLANLVFGGVDEYGDIEWIGTGQQFREYREFQAKDDRGEFFRYPWQDIKF